MRSSLLITFIQVTSRVVILWGIGYAFPEVRGHWSFVTMVISWAITEIVRYNFYVMPTNPLLLYLRCALFPPMTSLRLRSLPAPHLRAPSRSYTLFYILYPTGAGSEWIFAYQTLPLLTPPVLYVVYALLFLYFPLFPKQYFHMISQRRKVFSPRKDKKSE